jgi:hypothetical protein
VKALVLGLAIVLATPLAARADDGCQEDHLAAQKDRKAGKLVEARDEMLRCAAPSCADLVQKDCVRWLDEVNADLPTIVPSARASDGTELGAVHVSLDGAPWLDGLDGKAVPVDPGPHTLRFDARGKPPVDVQVIAKMGMKNEPAEATFVVGGAIGRPRAATIATWTLIGVGSASVLTFAGLAITGEVQYQQLKSSCAPACDPADVDRVRHEFIASDVLASIGAACIASAVIVYFAIPAKPAAPDAPPAENAALVLRPSPRGAALDLSIDF